MSYATIEASVLTILQGMTRFEDDNAITRSDYRALDKGYPEVIVIEPGGLEMPEPQLAGVEVDPIRYRIWQTKITMFERFSPDETTASLALDAMREAVIVEIEKNPEILDTTRLTDYMTLQSDGDPFDVYGKDGGGPFYRGQTLRLRVREIVYINY